MRSAEISGLDELEEEMAREKAAKKQAKRDKKKNAPSGASVAEVAEKSATTDTVESEQTQEADTPVCTNATANAESADGGENESKKEKKDKDKKENSLLTSAVMIIATVLGLCLSIGLFIMLPTFIYDWMTKLMPFMITDNLAADSLIKSFFEGILKITVLVGYMALVTLLMDI